MNIDQVRLSDCHVPPPVTRGSCQSLGMISSSESSRHPASANQASPHWSDSQPQTRDDHDGRPTLHSRAVFTHSTPARVTTRNLTPKLMRTKTGPWSLVPREELRPTVSLLPVSRVISIRSASRYMLVYTWWSQLLLTLNVGTWRPPWPVWLV